MAWIAFDAEPLARVLDRFPPHVLDRMQVVVDIESRRISVELSGVREAVQFLEEQGFVRGRDYRLGDAVDVAGSVILELEREDGKPNLG